MSSLRLTCEPVEVLAGEVCLASVSFVPKLDEGETLSAVSSATASGLTVSGAAVTTVAKTINGRDVDAYKAVTCLVSGQAADTDYTLVVTCTTSAGQTRKIRCPIRCLSG